jgi:hypothetical protein
MVIISHYETTVYCITILLISTKIINVGVTIPRSTSTSLKFVTEKFNIGSDKEQMYVVTFYCRPDSAV